MELAVRSVVVAVLTVLLLTSACGESPTDPSSQIPNVAGTYTGPITLSSAGRTLATGTARMTVVQAGAQLTITGSVAFSGATFQITAVTGTINRTGFFTPSRRSFTNRVTDPTCGTITPVDASLTFAGNTARYVENSTTDFCGPLQLSGTLRRQ